MKSVINHLKISIWPVWLSIILLMACNQSPKIKGFDSGSWQGDHDGCSGIRKTSLPVLLSARDRMLGKNEEYIINLLGKPDRNDLYERDQKFYIYFLDPGPSCSQTVKDPEMLVVRFTSLGICDDVFEQRGFSTK